MCMCVCMYDLFVMYVCIVHVCVMYVCSMCVCMYYVCMYVLCVYWGLGIMSMYGINVNHNIVTMPVSGVLDKFYCGEKFDFLNFN